jgi:hypothetical protein
MCDTSTVTFVRGEKFKSQSHHCSRFVRVLRDDFHDFLVEERQFVGLGFVLRGVSLVGALR